MRSLEVENLCCTCSSSSPSQSHRPPNREVKSQWSCQSSCKDLQRSSIQLSKRVGPPRGTTTTPGTKSHVQSEQISTPTPVRLLPHRSPSWDRKNEEQIWLRELQTQVRKTTKKTVQIHFQEAWGNQVRKPQNDASTPSNRQRSRTHVSLGRAEISLCKFKQNYRLCTQVACRRHYHHSSISALACMEWHGIG